MVTEEGLKKSYVKVPKGTARNLLGELSAEEMLETSILSNQLAIILEENPEDAYEDATEDQIEAWRQKFAFLEDSIDLASLNIADLEILEEQFGDFDANEFPPYAHLTARKKKKFFKKLTEDYHKINKPTASAIKRKSI